jgi:hypothetical protein
MRYISFARCCALVFVFAVAAFGMRCAQAAIISTQTFGGNTYHLLDAKSWQASQTEAQTLGGNLVTVNSAAENNFLYGVFGPIALANSPASGKVNLWLGTTDMDVEGVWKWVSGLTSSYSNWFANQPQDTYGDEDYGGIRVRGANATVPVGKWIDIVSNGRLGDRSFGIVEILSGSIENPPVPEPGAFVLAALGGAIVVGKRYVNRRRGLVG